MKAHAPAPYDKQDVMAIRACLSGTANESQQKRAMDWIITRASNLYDMSYRDQAEGGTTATAFHEGRRFVGSQIVKLSLPATLKAVEAAEKKATRPKRTREAKPNDSTG